MVLCRQCSHTTRLTMLNCPRCGYSLPYWRSRRWRVRYEGGGVTVGKKCPWCGRTTRRQRTPLLLKPMRSLSGQRCSYRTCNCGWSGIAFHEAASRQSHP
ncbi:MAG TPA: hypothetical protein VEX86_10035 [Longimicrobium sp.]|nr:hypothetical protein [Longimicrobium sp.]